MKRSILPRLRCCAAALTVLLCVWSPTHALAQEEGPVTSKGENFSAKPPAALFNSDCTGAGCHKGPQGLGKGQSQSGLAGFLREHYTNSRESAAALAGYLLKLPAGPEPREQREARPTWPGRGEPASPGFGEGFFGSKPKQREAKPEPKPESKPAETRTSRQHPAPKSSRAAAKPEDKPDEAAPAAAESKEASPKEKEEAAPKEAPKEAAPKEKETPVRQARPTRAQRGKATAAAPPPPPEPPPAPAPPPKKEYDIFD